jgi:heme/copper-type cytochrome/quinol oxidase subunit 2
METINQPNQQETMSVKDWLITLVITCIPLVGFIMLFVWAFSDSGPVARRNWAKAGLILAAILIVVYILIAILFGAAFIAAASGGGAYS